MTATMRPEIEADTQFESGRIKDVRSEGEHGWSIRREDGWSFCVPADSPIEPKAGMECRFYGEGIGRPVRGLVMDGQVVFYRTAAEDEQHHKEESYGKDAAVWVARFDEGRSVWSIEMGGLGPGYEQALQITAV